MGLFIYTTNTSLKESSTLAKPTPKPIKNKYESNFTTIKNPMTTKDFIASTIQEQESIVQESAIEKKRQEQHLKAQEGVTENVLNKIAEQEVIKNKYISFVESTKISFLSECIYNVYKKAMDPDIIRQENSTAIMRSMVNGFINEEEVGTILFKMKNGSNLLSEMHNLVNKYTKMVTESVDKNNPETFCIDYNIRDKFFEELKLDDVEEVAAAIKQRVSDAIDEFIYSNNVDRIDIKDTLQAAKEKMESIEDDENPDEVIGATSQEIKESYDHLAKRKISEIRGRKKNLFHSLVSVMAENVVKNKDLQSEFMTENKINMPKIVDRISLMYTFMETTNSMKLVKVDENYVNEVLESMKM